MNYFHFLAERPLITVFPSVKLIVDGKKCIPSGRTFFFDLESYEGCGVSHYGEVYLGTDSIKDFPLLLPDYDAATELLAAQKRLETYFKIYSGLPFLDILKHTTIKKDILIYYSIFDKILDRIFTKSQKPNYKFMRAARHLVEMMAQKPLNLDKSKLSNSKVYPDRILFNIYKSSTGRFITKSKSFPIHNISKEKRSMIRPNNDIFVQLDQRAADFRTFLYLFSGDKQTPSSVSDLYECVDGETREEKKKNVFQMIYAKNYSSDLVDHSDIQKTIYKMISKENDDSIIILTPKFKRELKIPKKEENIDNLMISHLIQSITSDITVDACLKINDIISKTESYIAFTIHDAVVLDMKIEDYHKYIKLIKNVVEDTPVGRAFWKTTVGNNFGEMYNEGDFDWNTSY